MKRPISYVLLVGCTALLPTLCAAGDEPAGMIMPTPRSSDTIGWTNPPQHIPPTPPFTGLNVPPIESPGRPPAVEGHSVEVPDVTAVASKADSVADDTVQAKADEDAFLLPIWERGFWLMPPGGLTRYLIPAGGFINPNVTLVPVFGNANSG